MIYPTTSGCAGEICFMLPGDWLLISGCAGDFRSTGAGEMISTGEKTVSGDGHDEEKLAMWDPMKDAYESPVFNSYEQKSALDMSQDPR